MSPSDLYSAALAILTSTRSSMLSPAWQAALDQTTPGTRLLASHELIAVQQGIVALSNASLSDFADKMAAQKQDLTDCIADLNDTLQDLTQVQDVLQSVSSLITVVGKIVPLL
jgi:hypothetical protein